QLQFIESVVGALEAIFFEQVVLSLCRNLRFRRVLRRSLRCRLSIDWIGLRSAGVLRHTTPRPRGVHLVCPNERQWSPSARGWTMDLDRVMRVTAARALKRNWSEGPG